MENDNSYNFYISWYNISYYPSRIKYMKKKPYTICSFCNSPEISPGGHKPVNAEPETTWWFKVHEGHPKFEAERDRRKALLEADVASKRDKYRK